MVLYADARSHLTIARRLIEGPNDGIRQLGTVWLPLPHLLLAPFTAVTSWWRSGLAAAPLDIGCLVIEAVSLFVLVRTVTRRRAIVWVAVALYLSNPSILYLHTTALTEPVLFAALLATSATLAHWAVVPKAYSGGEIAVFCGLPAAATVLSRYDGWSYIAAATAVVFIVAWRRWKSRRYAFHIARCFATLPVLAAAWVDVVQLRELRRPPRVPALGGTPPRPSRSHSPGWSAPRQGESRSERHHLHALGSPGRGWVVVGAAVVGLVLVTPRSVGEGRRAREPRRRQRRDGPDHRPRGAASPPVPARALRLPKPPSTGCSTPSPPGGRRSQLVVSPSHWEKTPHGIQHGPEVHGATVEELAVEAA